MILILKKKMRLPYRIIMKKIFLLMALLILVYPAYTQNRGLKLVKPPTAKPTNENRKAIVIGMSEYGGNKNLNNTLNDANDMADALTMLGFEVTLLRNNNLRNLETNLTNWYNTIEHNDMAIFYFAGHGVEVAGENFLIPVDAELSSEADIRYNTLSVNKVLDNMDLRKVRFKLLILDACRDNPFTRGWNRSSSATGLAGMIAPKGTLIAFAAAPGKTAQDGGTHQLRNGVFTHFLKQEIVKKGLTIDNILNRVAGSVSNLTNDQQLPYKSGIVTEDFYFIPPMTGDHPIPDPVPENPQVQIVKVEKERHPSEPEMVFVQGGSFMMGCTAEQGYYCENHEKPSHQISVSSFYIGKYEVTQAQWKAIMGTTVRQQLDKTNSNWPIVGEGDNYPMYYVNWVEVQEFIRLLNEATGKKYRLLTEAEWEYAARGGNKSQGYKYSGSNNLLDVAWFEDNTGNGSHQVGLKRANELGIYDLSGNVWEWCQDWYGAYSSSTQRNPIGASTGSYRVLRGGSWNGVERNSRVSNRSMNTTDSRFYDLGFRLAYSSN